MGHKKENVPNWNAFIPVSDEQVAALSRCYHHDMPQGSEGWERVRKGKLTASQFSKFITAKTLKMSASAIDFACELAAQRAGVETPPPQPTFWMEYGLESEPWARDAFRHETGLDVDLVGFCERVDLQGVGCSPDGLIGAAQMLEIKCPKSETLIKYHIADEIPSDYMMQMQAALWITGRSKCHFWAWHGNLSPFHRVVEVDAKYHEAFDSLVPEFMQLVWTITGKIELRVNND